MPLGHGQTATWLNKNDKFQSWIRGDTKRLTICGPAGIGKTHLVSNIVSQLKPKIGLQNRMQEREALVHVVDWKDKDRLDPTSVLLSFLFQLLKSNADLFKQIYNRMHDPPVIYEDLEHLLVDLLSNSRLKHLELIVHGIDNMDQSSRDQVGNTLSRLVSAKRGMPNAKVLLTCRSCGIFSDEVEASFSNLDLGPSERFRLSLEEVARTGESSVEFTAYVKQCITAMPNSHKLPTELRDLIEERLLRKTVGVQEIQGIWKYNALQPNSLRNNFLWISLVADLIGSEQSPSNVKKVLKVATDQLNDLDLVYTQLIERTPPDVEIVQILTFIKCARRPMSLQELTFAIAIHSQHHSAQEVVEDQFFSLDTILESYASALVLFQNDTVSLVHSSLSDYLERHSPDSMDFSHQELAKACMWSLFLGARTQGVQLSPNAQEETFFNTSTHPFMRYASEFWFEHVRLALPYDFDGLVFNLTMRFVNSDSWTRWKFWYCKLRGKGTYPSNASPVHIFAALGLLGHAKAVKSLWSDINQKDESGKSVIYYAAANNAQGTIDFILDKCGNALLLDATDQELLYLAVTKTNLRLLKKILEQPNLELPHSLLIAAIDGRHWSALGLLKRYLEDSRSREQVLQYWVTVSDDNGGALHHAVLSRNLSLVESFLDEGGKPNDSTGGKTPLHLAAQIGDELITEELIAAGGLVDIKDESHNNTPLHYATEAGSLKVVQLLLEHGADITSLNSKKQTSLHVAARCGHEDIVLLLLASGAEVNGKDEDGTTPLHLASAGSWDPIVRRLLDQGGDACATSYNKRTPLHLAAANGSREIAGMLLAAGAPVNAKDHNDQTPLHAAVQRGSVDLVLMLIERGADPSAVDESGKSPLHYAVAADSASAKIVQLLMETGADADLRDGAQKTALDFAAAEGNNIIAALLCAPRRKPDEDLKSWVAVEPMEYQVTVFEKNLSISKTTD